MVGVSIPARRGNARDVRSSRTIGSQRSREGQLGFCIDR